ncbi:CRISPR-associated endonuclease Cas3'' [Streptomyces sp. INR7]|uniref:CRISPR-associated endonuclease Cas3'' n=1 Tax=Streptomyces sp. INR7 TaxID=2607753 RepID=UPI00162A9777|nr:CRISPR-associated endonuclease Cas3'' [Streptomyces sp. INR7]QNE24121.1 CRISPR-associated endonuclease Cas3'' [Streptomyces sp. INR7]
MSRSLVEPRDDSDRHREELWAHSRSTVTGLRHTLQDHLRGSASLACVFGDAFGMGPSAEYLALVHDVGKGSCAWQVALLERAERLGGRVGVPHKGAGALLAAQVLGRPFASPVVGHHGGMPSLQELGVALTELVGRGPEAEAAREATARVARVVPEIRRGRIPPPSWLSGPEVSAPELGLRVDLLVRMLFSCLVDADFLDTEAHFAGTCARLSCPADMASLAARFEERRREMLAGRTNSPLDDVRGAVYEQALAAAAGPPGMYVLHVPTGGAKTLAAGGFGLRHAAAHGKRRVVVAVPFISITEQNAQVYRDMLDPRLETEGGPVVLEHHSSVELDDEATAVWSRLAAENWDAPFIVTTTVQLFQSLFARTPSAMRKLHRLAGSVIILDEVQALPDRLLLPILSVLRGLVEHFGVTVVLASATQPEFWSLPRFDGVERRVVVSDVAELFRKLHRVRYEWRMDDGVTWESVAEEVTDAGERVLTIVNTTKDAALLHRMLTGPGLGRAWHLSTRMTAGHRREVITTIREDLKNGLSVRVVSTSLIEAGVDVDFPRVFRAWAPAESLQQAAGRCNRDGRLPEGVVVVFRVQAAGQPKDPSYMAALEATSEYFGPDLAFPDDLDALAAYFPQRYAYQMAGGAGMGSHIELARQALNFPRVAEEFQMITDEHSQVVVVIRCEEDREAIEGDVAALRGPNPCGPEVLRRLQSHMAALPRHEVRAALSRGLAEPVTGDLVLWRGHYDEDRGLDPFEPGDRGDYPL